MLRFFAGLFAIVIAYFILNPPLLLNQMAPPLPPRVTVVSKEGVSQYDYLMVSRAVGFTARVLAEKCGLTLEHDVRVTLTPDTITYATVLATEVGLDWESAAYQATYSAGTSRHSHVVINLGAAKSHNDTVFITAHELTHQYQFNNEENWTRFNWLIEGMADVIAANVVAADVFKREGDDQVGDYRKLWLATLRQAGARPPLYRLDNRRDWVDAARDFGPVAYRTADLAVFALVESKGYTSLADYVRLLNQGVGQEAAFQTVFGRPAGEFGQEYESWLLQIQDSGGR